MTDSSADPPEDVVYLDVDDALEVFGAIIGGTATQAADQLRDRAALEGALARPINYAQYENAVWRPGGDGGARHRRDPAVHRRQQAAALVVMLTFLEINGVCVEATDRELANWIISFSAGASPREVAMALRQRLTTAG